jgi:acetyl-CoA C-acetyltransferase
MVTSLGWFCSVRSDGAAAVMICNENGLKKLGLKPRAVITHLALAGTDPVLM